METDWSKEMRDWRDGFEFEVIDSDNIDELSDRLTAIHTNKSVEIDGKEINTFCYRYNPDGLFSKFVVWPYYTEAGRVKPVFGEVTNDSGELYKCGEGEIPSTEEEAINVAVEKIREVIANE